MSIILSEEKYNKVKAAIKDADGKYTQTQIGNSQFVSRTLVSRINMSKNYKDYLTKYTQALRQPTEAKKATKNSTPGSTKKPNFFSDLFGKLSGKK